MRNVESENRVLASAFREIAEEDRSLGASAAVASALTGEVVRLHEASRARPPRAFYALAASLFVGLAVPVGYVARRAEVPRPALADVVTNDRDGTAMGFYPLTYRNVPMTSGQVIRLHVSGATLVSLGLQWSDSRMSLSDLVDADVLVGEDGLARAVRLFEEQK